MSDRITLVKGKQRRTVNDLEYRLIKDDLNGWEVEREAPKVPDEVKAAVQAKERIVVTGTGTQSTPYKAPAKPRKK